MEYPAGVNLSICIDNRTLFICRKRPIRNSPSMRVRRLHCHICKTFRCTENAYDTRNAKSLKWSQVERVTIQIQL